MFVSISLNFPRTKCFSTIFFTFIAHAMGHRINVRTLAFGHRIWLILLFVCIKKKYKNANKCVLCLKKGIISNPILASFHSSYILRAYAQAFRYALGYHNNDALCDDISIARETQNAIKARKRYDLNWLCLSVIRKILCGNTNKMRYPFIIFHSKLILPHFCVQRSANQIHLPLFFFVRPIIFFIFIHLYFVHVYFGEISP